MSTLIQLDEFPETKEFLAALEKRFAGGAEIVSLVQDSRVIGVMLSSDAAKSVLARRAVERLVADPSALEDLETRLREKPDDWD